MDSIYRYNGEALEISHIDISDYYVKGVAHRGLSSVAPENTLPAYIAAKENGFKYAETDVAFTSDGVAVLLHDETIDRTSNGTGNVADLTWAQLQQYDFGSWKSSAYAGTKIPSFSQFLDLCRAIELHPYIELKFTASYTQQQVDNLVNMVAAKGMKDKVTWISFSSTYLGYVKNSDANARLGYIPNTLNSSEISTAQALKNNTNEVFIDTDSKTTTSVNLCKDANLPMEVWTIDSESSIIALDPYITGVTSNSLVASRVLYSNAMS